MIIRNETNKTVLSTNAIKATTFKHKSFGLIIAKKGTAMIFQTRFGIHTFFMNYPIDVVILNKQNTVVSIKKNLLPNKIFLWNPKYATIIELPEGSLAVSQTDQGNKLSFS